MGRPVRACTYACTCTCMYMSLCMCVYFSLSVYFSKGEVEKIKQQALYATRASTLRTGLNSAALFNIFSQNASNPLSQKVSYHVPLMILKFQNLVSYLHMIHCLPLLNKNNKYLYTYTERNSYAQIKGH